jgi:hypothetical protein
MKESNVCPNCGYFDKFHKRVVSDIDIDIKRKNVYKCYRCDYIGYYSVTKEEWVCINRTKLIDKMLQ